MTQDEIIEDYLDGYLNEHDKNDFEKMLKENPKLQKEYEFRREINNFIETKACVEEFKAKLKIIHNNNIDKNNKFININQFIKQQQRWLVAASIILLFGLSVLWYFNYNKANNPQKLYTQFYSDFEMKPLNRTSNNNFEIAFEDACNFYKNKQYKEANQKFSILMEANPKHNQLNFYFGLSLMQINNTKQAKEVFSTIIKNEDIEYLQSAEWYLALCLLREENLTDLKKLLKEISNENGEFASKASELLKKLN